jgi:hypothetical protein
VNEPVRSATTTTASDRPSTADNARSDAPRTTTGAATTTRAASDNWYPDHAVYNATKEELKQMPEF